MSKEKSEEDLGKKIRALHISPWIAGAIIGFLAASLQKIASMTAPLAYGFCMACHARDMINGVVNFFSGEQLLGVAPVLSNPIWIPPLTIIGVLLGSFVAALIYKEFHVTKSKSYGPYLKMFVLGVLVMNFALILSACPVRTSLRVAHGDVIALIGLLCIGIGAIIATVMLEKQVKV